ncbi:MAG: 3-hydroxyacyl-CoA dehydrogenase NAD-binding domain-containing protein [Cytophagales bacterium]|nr:3-hydroxyacyl-CoA dehydrogenase NAD-binding domain-containing protein [Cytophagales bacterium]
MSSTVISTFQVEHKSSFSILWMNQEDRPVNTIHLDFVNELHFILDQLEEQPKLQYILLASKKNTFVAGADLQVLREHPVKSSMQMIKAVHALFNRIERFPVPIIALLDGPAIGGGLELALACRYRIATANPKIRLSLPETGLGLIPGFGGTFRIPRLAGVSVALEMILKGSAINAPQALEHGLIDHLTNRDNIAAYQPDLLRTLSKTADRKSPENNSENKNIVEKNRNKVKERWGECCPAYSAAIDCVEYSLKHKHEECVASEMEHFERLLTSPQAKQLIQFFFTTNAMKKNPMARIAQPVHKISILGAGLMGTGIASISIPKGYKVSLADIQPEALHQAKSKLQKDWLEKYPKPLAREFMNKIVTGNPQAETLLDDSQLIIEAVYEDLPLKEKVLESVNEYFQENTIFASNTSALPIGKIARKARKPENVIGMHYFSPAQKMALLEIVSSPLTEEWVKATALQVGIKQGKTCIMVNDGPGFYTTRILAPYLNEALLLMREGVSPEAIDKALKKFGMPVGPVTLMDEIGIDVCAHLMGADLGELFQKRDTPLLPTLGEMASRGLLGRKSKSGFLVYDQESGRKIRGRYNEKLELFFPNIGKMKMDEEIISQRVSMSLINEALHCLSEGILLSPSDGDVGAVLGLGFPKFRGGPFRFLDSLGLPQAHEQLSGLQDQFGKRFKPAPVLTEFMQSEKTFHPNPI